MNMLFQIRYYTCNFRSDKSSSFQSNILLLIWLTGISIYTIIIHGLPVLTSVQFSSVQSLSCVRFFATPWAAAHQASLSITKSRSLLKLMSIESVMPSNHLFLCRPLLLLPSIFPSIRIFSNESALHIRWLKYWSFSFSINPSNEYSYFFFKVKIGFFKFFIKQQF